MGPTWLAAALPAGSIAAASRLGWGFRNESWRVDLVDGRRIVVTRFADASAAPAVVRRTKELGPRLRAAGIPVPEIVDPPGLGEPLLATRFVDGMVGAALLDVSPERVGLVMGAAWRILATLDTEGLDLPTGWACKEGLAAADRRGDLRRALDRLDQAQRPRATEALDRAGELLAGRRTGFVHGDFAPVNVIVRGDHLAALVDLELAGRADPLFDAAWFRWIVGYHHPPAEGTAWAAFRSAARIDDAEPAAGLLRVLPVIGLLERLGGATVDAEVDHWRAMLRSILERDP